MPGIVSTSLLMIDSEVEIGEFVNLVLNHLLPTMFVIIQYYC